MIDGYFKSPAFEEVFDFHQQIADADPSVFGACVFGNTCLNHMIAIDSYGTEVTEDNLFITAFSFLTPLWPGRDPQADLYVRVTPEP